MSDVTTNPTKEQQIPQADIPLTVPSSPPNSLQPSNPPKVKSKKSRKPKPRRRVAASDESEGDQASDTDDNDTDDDASLTSDDEGQEGDKHVSPASSASPQKTTETLSKPIFADAKSTTPLGWTDSTDQPTEVVSFGDLNKIANVAKMENGNGKEKKERTKQDEERIAARKAKQKEKSKAKRDMKKKERQAAKLASKGDSHVTATTQAHTNGSKNDQHSVDSLITPTSALTIDSSITAIQRPTSNLSATPAGQSRHGRSINREVHLQDSASKSRGGGFWTHDQGLPSESGAVGEMNGFRQSNEYGRGRFLPRGGMRGGFRGRVRGMANMFRPGENRAHQRYPQAELQPQVSSGGGLRMDELERELEQRERQRAETKAKAESEAKTEIPEQPVEEKHDVPKSQPPVLRSEKKWGHEGFEAQLASEVQVPFNPFLRGRGRGRNQRGFPHLAGFGPHRPFQPVARNMIPAQNHTEPSPLSKTDSLVTSFPAVDKFAEANSTAPTAEKLLASSGVTIRLPGSTASTTVSIPTAPSSNSNQISQSRALTALPSTTSVAPSPHVPSVQPVPSITSAPSAPPSSTLSQTSRLPPISQLPPSFVPGQPYQGSTHPSPQPYLTANNTGSLSSGAFSQQHTGPFPPAEYYSPTPPLISHPHVNPYAQRNEEIYYAQEFQPRSSFSAPVPVPSPPMFFPQQYDTRSPSPYTPMPMNMQMQQGIIPNNLTSEYFVPAQKGQKISIRRPVDKDKVETQYARVNSINTNVQYPSTHYNPYAAGQNGMNGNGVNGMNGGGMYYQGGEYQVSAYGYEQYDY
ncbi:hypothetical protein M231_00244 [Tremella mesenterica]|uniref:Btz domain-containing protein n=1 Tax=Tremella mesenterica TaxID=5217 RepID=A0A4Q1BWY9_TREME|nr:hypothetical protein M231_00244 [Tremella mesenterica]